MKKNAKLGNILELFSKSKKVSIDKHETNSESICCSNMENNNLTEKVRRNDKNYSLKISKYKCLDTCKICNLETLIPPDWHSILEEEFKKDYFFSIKEILHAKPFYPPIESVFTFSKFFSLNETKVVIIGQDPYHNHKQAMGLSFSVPEDMKIPPSLKNIYKELKDDIPGFTVPSHGSLIRWARQGVLLLNDALTVECNKPSSHSKIGWNIFTERIIKIINHMCSNVVFMLWGSFARSKSPLIHKEKHLVLEAAHPSPYSAQNFFGCRHFSKANEYLKKNGKEPIRW